MTAVQGIGSERAHAHFDRLIEAVARERDRDAYRQLFEHFAPRLKSYLLRCGASDAMAEDFSQDAMLSVWRKADLFDARRAGAAAWIFTIARNRRIDMLRREGRPVPAPDLSLQPDDPVAPDAEVGGEQEAMRLRAALSTLSREQAEVIRLSFFEERAHADISRALGLPLGTVKSRIRMAMMKLKNLLEPSAPGDRS